MTKVLLISSNFVTLKDIEFKVLEFVEKQDRKIELNDYNYHLVYFKETEGDISKSEDLIQLLTGLAELGVSFSRDYKQTYPPSYTMQYLREKKLYSGKIIGCGFNGKYWVYEEI